MTSDFADCQSQSYARSFTNLRARFTTEKGHAMAIDPTKVYDCEGTEIPKKPRQNVKDYIRHHFSPSSLLRVYSH